jgi:hypothetical protein
MLLWIPEFSFFLTANSIALTDSSWQTIIQSLANYHTIQFLANYHTILGELSYDPLLSFFKATCCAGERELFEQLLLISLEFIVISDVNSVRSINPLSSRQQYPAFLLKFLVLSKTCVFDFLPQLFDILRFLWRGLLRGCNRVSCSYKYS